MNLRSSCCLLLPPDSFQSGEEGDAFLWAKSNRGLIMYVLDPWTWYSSSAMTGCAVYRFTEWCLTSLSSSCRLQLWGGTLWTLVCLSGSGVYLWWLKGLTSKKCMFIYPESFKCIPIQVCVNFTRYRCHKYDSVKLHCELITWYTASRLNARSWSGICHLIINRLMLIK